MKDDDPESMDALLSSEMKDKSLNSTSRKVKKMKMNSSPTEQKKESRTCGVKTRPKSNIFNEATVMSCL